MDYNNFDQQHALTVAIHLHLDKYYPLIKKNPNWKQEAYKILNRYTFKERKQLKKVKKWEKYNL